MDLGHQRNSTQFIQIDGQNMIRKRERDNVDWTAMKLNHDGDNVVRDADAVKIPIKYHGLYWCKSHKSWRVRVKFNNKRYHVGYYKDKLEAARIYDREAIKIKGNRAKLNFPDHHHNIIDSVEQRDNEAKRRREIRNDSAQIPLNRCKSGKSDSITFNENVKPLQFAQDSKVDTNNNSNNSFVVKNEVVDATHLIQYEKMPLHISPKPQMKTLLHNSNNIYLTSCYQVGDQLQQYQQQHHAISSNPIQLTQAMKERQGSLLIYSQTPIIYQLVSINNLQPMWRSPSFRFQMN